jgi:cell division protein FtsB
VRWLLVALLLILGILQYRLWIAEGSLGEQARLKRQVEEQVRINRELRERNAVLEREVLELQTGNAGVEQRAREQLGLVREDEVFYQFVDKDPAVPGPNGVAPPPDPERDVAAKSQ